MDTIASRIGARIESESMGDEKLDLLKGTLDLLVLQILSSMRPLHGYGLARRLEQLSGDQLAMNEGTIYASLVRLHHLRAAASTSVPFGHVWPPGSSGPAAV